MLFLQPHHGSCHIWAPAMFQSCVIYIHQFTLIFSQTLRGRESPITLISQMKKLRLREATRSNRARFQADPKACLLITTLLSTAQMVPPLSPTTLLIPSLWVPMSLYHSSLLRVGMVFVQQIPIRPLCAGAKSSPQCPAPTWWLAGAVIWTALQFLRSGWNKRLLTVNILKYTI